MKFVGKIGLILVLVSVIGTLSAQGPGNMMTESGQPLPTTNAPVDDIVERRIIKNKKILPYDDPREADIFWEKRVWRLLDTREKMNLPWRYPKRPFLQILIEAIYAEEDPLVVYRDEAFTEPFDTADLSPLLFNVDTTIVVDPETYVSDTLVVKDDIDFENSAQRYRIKEIWFFDKGTSTMKVRIKGIAPLIGIKQEGTNRVLDETPLFWVYYPHARKLLAQERVFNEFNDAAQLSWEDIFEMRYFSSFIIKVSNVQDQYLRTMYKDNPRQQLLEAEKLKQEIFNFEHDLWSY